MLIMHLLKRREGRDRRPETLNNARLPQMLPVAFSPCRKDRRHEKQFRVLYSGQHAIPRPRQNQSTQNTTKCKTSLQRKAGSHLSSTLRTQMTRIFASSFAQGSRWAMGRATSFTRTVNKMAMATATTARHGRRPSSASTSAAPIASTLLRCRLLWGRHKGAHKRTKQPTH